jgi:hypothetical protein
LRYSNWKSSGAVVEIKQGVGVRKIPRTCNQIQILVMINVPQMQLVDIGIIIVRLWQSRECLIPEGAVLVVNENLDILTDVATRSRRGAPPCDPTVPNLITTR